MPAEVLFVIFALLASFAFCFSVAFAIFAFFASSLSFFCFHRTSPAEEFLWMTYIETDVCDRQRGTHWVAMCQRNVKRNWAMLLQPDDFIISSILWAKEKVSGPCEKIGFAWRIVCIVIVASGWRGHAVRGWALM